MPTLLETTQQDSVCTRYLPRYVCFADLFGNDRPVEIEIGCGKGIFLVSLAERFPFTNFIGLDLSGKWMKKGESKQKRRKLNNLKFIKTEAKAFLSECIPPESVRAFYIYFPDPWPKNKHRRRRLISDEFVESIFAKLQSGGIVDIATDDKLYFAHIENVARKGALPWQTIAYSDGQRISHPEVLTNYEVKYKQEGRPIYYLSLLK